MSIQSNFPAISPSLLLDFANVQQLDPRITFTRASTATYFDQFGVIQTAASDVARFDHNPTTFESLGLLIEESRTNLLRYSEQFDNAAWTNVRSSITSNALIAPDGTLTSDKLVIDTTAAANHSVGQATTITSGTTYTWVVYAKAGEFTEINLRFSAQFTAGSTFFNLLTGVTTNVGGVSTSSATPVGNGWYRCSITQTANTSGAAQPQVFLAQGNSITIATGNGVSGIYIWGAQLETGAFRTSYIPTVASQVTRAADVAVMTGTNFSSWYNATEGTLFAEGESVNAFTGTVGRRYAEINDGTGSNVVNVEFRNTTQSRFNVSASAVSQAAITSGGTINQFSKLAGAYAANNFAFSANGTLGTPDTSGTVPVVSQLNIGNRADNVASATINGHIKKIAYYPRRLSNAELQGITA